MEYTWWWYRLNHVLYEVRSPLVGYPVVKKGCIATLEGYREFLKESAGFHALIVTSVAGLGACQFFQLFHCQGMPCAK